MARQGLINPGCDTVGLCGLASLILRGKKFEMNVYVSFRCVCVWFPRIVLVSNPATGAACSGRYFRVGNEKDAVAFEADFASNEQEKKESENAPKSNLLG